MPFLAVIISALLWTVASQLFALLSRRMHVLRLNFYKSILGLIFFTMAAVLLDQIIPQIVLLGSHPLLEWNSRFCHWGSFPLQLAYCRMGRRPAPSSWPLSALV